MKQCFRFGLKLILLPGCLIQVTHLLLLLLHYVFSCQLNRHRTVTLVFILWFFKLVCICRLCNYINCKKILHRFANPGVVCPAQDHVMMFLALVGKTHSISLETSQHQPLGGTHRSIFWLINWWGKSPWVKANFPISNYSPDTKVMIKKAEHLQENISCIHTCIMTRAVSTMV